MDAKTKMAIAIARAKQGQSSVQDKANMLAARNSAMAARAGVQSDPAAMADMNAQAEQAMAQSQMSRPAAAFFKGAQGMSFGFNDELVGAMLGDEARDKVRQAQDVADTAYPVQGIVAETAGAIANPTTFIAPVGSIGRAALTGGAVAAAEGAGNAEGSAMERLDDAAVGGALGFFTAGAADGILRGLGKGVSKVMDKTKETPTVEGLKAIRDQAYKAVQEAGIGFDVNDMTALNNRINRLARTARYDIDPSLTVDDGAVAALKRVGNRLQAMEATGKPISLNNLDKMRQNLFDIYGKTDHPFVLEVIGEIDTLIEKTASADELMGAARTAHKHYAQSQLLRDAFEKADRATAASGSGGNVLNNYRRAVNQIINRPREAKYFSEEQIALMKSFVMGDNAENALRRAGKLAPGGNGLMTALNVYAAAVDPTMLAITAASSGAKAAADNSAMKGSQELIESVATGVIPTPKPRMNTAPFAVGAGALVNER